MPNLPTIVTVVIPDREGTGHADLHALLDQIPPMQVLEQVREGIQGTKLIINLGAPGALPDLARPDVSAVEFQKQLRANCPETITLVLIDDHRGAYLASVMESGAESYLKKDLGIGQFLSAIRRAARGESLPTDE